MVVLCKTQNESHDVLQHGRFVGGLVRHRTFRCIGVAVERIEIGRRVIDPSAGRQQKLAVAERRHEQSFDGKVRASLWNVQGNLFHRLRTSEQRCDVQNVVVPHVLQGALCLLPMRMKRKLFARSVLNCKRVFHARAHENAQMMTMRNQEQHDDEH